ncbi:L-piperidine-6-carboxylate dehydrogenase [Mucisphaera sp.]|uniref:L-piperidine-6-carboxylate dehydrogenase n=1 Tax=Mucisphaera sp. TaxID=2913024 RepID=UPI003D117C41
MSDVSQVLKALGLTDSPDAVAIGHGTSKGAGASLAVKSPIDGAPLATMTMGTPGDVERAIDVAHEAFLSWRSVPAPKRGELVRRYGNKLREYKETLGKLVTLEVGKIPAEAEGEVQEMIDICDFAVGLSRQLYGLSIQSERPGHRLTEQWHPLGAVGVISAFNFPVAVWAWNSALALVCGDSVVWKPSEKAPLCALACHRLLMETIKESADLDAPEGLSSVVIGMRDVGQALAASGKLPLVSATGSVPMGKSVGETVGARLGRALLELGGNNAMIVTPSADLDLAVRAITFSAVGTAGQRCTTLRRLIVHESLKDELVGKLVKIFESVKVGDPREAGVLVGPLIDAAAGEAMEATLAKAASLGGKQHGGGVTTEGVPSGGTYAKPAIVEIDPKAEVVQQETFAPILYVLTYQELEEAISIQNDVPQGLSSAIFTGSVLDSEVFCGPAGSDCGIANVNIGTSGAEIGGAFGGEKETGGGRESGSDAWKNYMRRATNTVNYTTELPLAQGITFDV